MCGEAKEIVRWKVLVEELCAGDQVGCRSLSHSEYVLFRWWLVMRSLALVA